MIILLCIVFHEQRVIWNGKRENLHHNPKEKSSDVSPVKETLFTSKRDLIHQ